MNGDQFTASHESSNQLPDDYLLETRQVTKTFGELVAVNGVSLGIEQNELRSLIGPNGAGKTTLFNLITGTLPADTGSVYFDSEDITQVPTEIRAQRGIVRSYQSSQLFGSQTVAENVRIAVQTSVQGTFKFDVRSRGHNIGREQTERVLDQVGLSHKRDTKAKNLSHGEQRKLSIAIALATDPELLMLDEPTSGIGPEDSERMTNLIRDIHAENDVSVLMIEHNIDIVMEISDRISVLHRGALIKTGQPEEVRNDDDVQEAYLGGVKEQ